MAKPQHRTPEHRAARRAINKAQARGEILWCVEPVCVMPSRSIYPDQPAHVSHNPSGSAIMGPSHAPCNAHEAAVRGNRTRGKPIVGRWAL